MPEPTPKPIFLSYARDDAAAVRRVAAALRGAGLDVWFDESELIGGDAWDQKIRTKIAECALFIPVISANTQARLEGYFRLEWRLAEQRSHLMAKGKRFLVPVCIDATREQGAQVPDAFMEIQWTRLPGGETAPPFVELVQRLLAGAAPRPSTPALADDGSRQRGAPQPRGPAVAWIGAVAVVGIGVGAIFWAPRKPETSGVAKSHGS
jgi:TIR domain